MRNKSRLIKGPRATAADYEANRERMQIRRDAEARDRAELAEYAEAMRSGNQARATEIALARQARSRATLYPQGVIECEAARQAGATEPLLAGTQTPESASPAPAPRRSMASQFYANHRRHGADGKFIDRKFAAQVDAIAQRIRDARAARDSEGGAA